VKIQKFNESIELELGSFARSVISDIRNVLTDLTDNGYTMDLRILHDTPGYGVTKESPELIINLTCGLTNLMDSHGGNVRNIRNIHWDDNNHVEKMKKYSYFFQILSENIEEIKDRFQEMDKGRIQFQSVLLNYQDLSLKITVKIK